eukprot:2911675-Amphidinium_carterae.1
MPSMETIMAYSSGPNCNSIHTRWSGSPAQVGSWLIFMGGRKVYRKPAGKGPDAVDVFLYYWNDSDGASFQGWWFGNEVGGSQVQLACRNPTGGASCGEAKCRLP